MADVPARLRAILDLYLRLINTVPPSDYGRRRPKIKIPVVPSDLFLPLINCATSIFKSEPNVLFLSPPINIIGDLHGSLFDLMRVLHDVGLPPGQSYLVLGDFIDRGPFSTETILLLLLLKIAYPQNVWLVRGNHEFKEACVPHEELSSELAGLYLSRAFLDPLFDMFAWLPIAADICHYAFAVHGGISPALIAIGQLEEIPRPITGFRPKLIEDILWSDPSEQVTGAIPSGRGLGNLFGIDVVRQFFARTKYQVIFRGHQPITGGVEMTLGYKVATIFSASNYCGDPDTCAGIVHVNVGQSWDKRIFEALPPVERENVVFLGPDEFKPKQSRRTSEARTMSRQIPPIGPLPRVPMTGRTPRATSVKAEIPERQSPRRIPQGVSPRRHSSAS
jgi:protein phosphatase